METILVIVLVAVVVAAAVFGVLMDKGGLPFGKKKD